MRPLHGHLVRERPKIVPKLYEQFTKIRKSVVQQFHKLEQHRKTSKADEAPRPLRCNDNPCNYPRPVHNIDLDVAGHQRIGKRILGHLCKRETHELPIKGLFSTTK
jgi:hypothetical protein